jgi:hypothetical protein
VVDKEVVDKVDKAEVDVATELNMSGVTIYVDEDWCGQNL